MQELLLLSFIIVQAEHVHHPGHYAELHDHYWLSYQGDSGEVLLLAVPLVESIFYYSTHRICLWLYHMFLEFVRHLHSP